MYEIRQAKASDWPAIERFILATYGASARYKGTARWRWQMENTPYAEMAEGCLPSWIALHRGTVVGQISLQQGQLWMGERSENIGWIVDVMIDPAHRGAGLGHRIYAAIRDSGQTLVTLTMAEATRRMAQRLDCITLPPVKQFLRIERLSSRTVAAFVLARTENRQSLRRIGRLFVASRIGPWLLSRTASLTLRLLHPRDVLDQLQPDIVEPQFLNFAAIERITATMRTKISAMFDRSPAFCTWRFDAAPDLNYHRAERISDGQTIGMIVWRLPIEDEMNIGTIVDILADPDDTETIQRLIAHAAARMADSCDGIVAGASHPAFIAAFARAGFFAPRLHHPTVVGSSRDTLARYATISGDWHMTKADHDWDQVHPIDH